MGEMIALASGKGGIGKSVLTLCIGTILAQQGKSVLLLDLCAGMRQLDILMGMENQIVFDWADVMAGDCALEQALFRTCKPNLFLACAPQHGAAAFDSGSFEALFGQLRQRFDYILADTPSGLAHGYGFLPHQTTDQVLLITSPDDAAIRDAERTRMLLEDKGHSVSWLLINRAEPGGVHAGYQYQPDVVRQTLDLPLLGIVPEDKRWSTVVLQRQWMRAQHPDKLGPATESIAHIARRLAGLERLPKAWTVIASAKEKAGLSPRFRLRYRQMVKEVWL